METKLRRPDADHAPAVEEDDGNGDGVEHGLGAEVVAALDEPEGINANGLGSQSIYNFSFQGGGVGIGQ